MKGIFTALLTPFNSDYTINEKALEKLVRFNLDEGIHGFYVGGSTGESMLMTAEERKRVFEIVKNVSGGSVPLIAHAGAIPTDAAIDMALCAKRLGYDAVSAVAPFYYSFPVPAIKKYYSDIVNAADMPMLIYNFPAGNGFGLDAKTAGEIFGSDRRFFGIKHTSNDLFAIRQFKDSIEGITVFMCKYGVFQCEKEMLSLMGIEMGPCRRPFLPLDDEGKEAVKKLYNKIDNGKNM